MSTPTRTYKYVTDKQAQYLANLVNARFDVDAPGRNIWRERFSAIRTNADVGTFIDDIKLQPTLESLRDRAQEEYAANQRKERPTEVGYYRDPETGTLYRLRKSKVTGWDLLVSRYSKTGGLRRLSVEGNLVKGSWKNFGSWDSRRLLNGTIKREWLLTEDQLTDFAYGFCPYHGGPLSDGVSVALGYGKTCADRQGLPWSEEAAQAVLDNQQKEN